MQICIFFSN